MGAFAAFSSWAFYGSGASIELAQVGERAAISLRFSALAGAFLVGVAGAKWITNEADKQLLQEGIRTAVKKAMPAKAPEEIVQGNPRQVLQKVKEACESCPENPGAASAAD